MAADKKSQSAAEKPLKKILEKLQDVHHRDIMTYTHGHLNPVKLHKASADSRRMPWETSKQPPLRMKPPSYPVNLPVRKNQLNPSDQKITEMENILTEFSMGTFSSLPLTVLQQLAWNKYQAKQKQNLQFLKSEEQEKKSKTAAKTMLPLFSSEDTLTESSERGSTPSSASVEKTSDEDKDTKKLAESVFTEELHLPEIMLPKSPRQMKTGKPDPSLNMPYEFLDSYLGKATKTDQFKSFQKFDHKVVNQPNANDRGMITGATTVKQLEKKLIKNLRMIGEEGMRAGPNWRRLQVYSGILSDIIRESGTFGTLLNDIKNAYEGYLYDLLDSQKPSQHRQLYEQLSQPRNQNVSTELKKEQEKLSQLEEEAEKVLQENERLRTQLAREQQLDLLPVQTTEESIARPIVKVDSVPKDLKEQIEDLHVLIREELGKINTIKKHQKEDCVPLSVCQHLEQCIKETEVEIQKLFKQNEFLEQSIEELEEEMEQLLKQTGTPNMSAKRLWSRINALQVIQLDKENESV